MFLKKKINKGGDAFVVGDIDGGEVVCGGRGDLCEFYFLLNFAVYLKLP